MVLLDGSTGLRRGELIALRWRDIDFELNQVNVTRSVWRNVEGDAKTEASRKPVPIHPIVVEQLKQWRLVTLYRADEDYLLHCQERFATHNAGHDSQTSHPAGVGTDRSHEAARVAFVPP
jgi:integrase